MDGLIWTLIVGGVVGWLAGIIMKTGGQMGILANIVVGIVGAVHRRGALRHPGARGLRLRGPADHVPWWGPRS